MNIAAAINDHLKALRHLDRTETSMGAIGEALGLDTKTVERAFEEFKMTAAKKAVNRFTVRHRTYAEQSPIVRLGR